MVEIIKEILPYIDKQYFILVSIILGLSFIIYKGLGKFGELIEAITIQNEVIKQNNEMIKDNIEITKELVIIFNALMKK